MIAIQRATSLLEKNVLKRTFFFSFLLEGRYSGAQPLNGRLYIFFIIIFFFFGELDSGDKGWVEVFFIIIIIFFFFYWEDEYKEEWG